MHVTPLHFYFFLHSWCAPAFFARVALIIKSDHGPTATLACVCVCNTSFSIQKVLHYCSKVFFINIGFGLINLDNGIELGNRFMVCVYTDCSKRYYSSAVARLLRSLPQESLFPFCSCLWCNARGHFFL